MNKGTDLQNYTRARDGHGVQDAATQLPLLLSVDESSAAVSTGRFAAGQSSPYEQISRLFSEQGSICTIENTDFSSLPLVRPELPASERREPFGQGIVYRSRIVEVRARARSPQILQPPIRLERLDKLIPAVRFQFSRNTLRPVEHFNAWLAQGAGHEGRRHVI